MVSFIYIFLKALGGLRQHHADWRVDRHKPPIFFRGTLITHRKCQVTPDSMAVRTAQSQCVILRIGAVWNKWYWPLQNTCDRYYVPVVVMLYIMYFVYFEWLIRIFDLIWFDLQNAVGGPNISATSLVGNFRVVYLEDWQFFLSCSLRLLVSEQVFFL